MQQLVPKPAIITAQDCIDTGWAQRVRDIILRDGQAIRHCGPDAIEVQSLLSNEWQPIMLPVGGIHFATTKDRDEVIDMLWGVRPC